MSKKKIGLTASAVLLAVAALAAFVATRPATYRVERSSIMAASPRVVLAQLADLRRWSSWSSWPHFGPLMQQTFGGPSTGTGSTLYWSSDGAPKGRMTIGGATAEKVEFEVELENPHSLSDLELRLAPVGAGTLVTWVLESSTDSSFESKVRTLFENPGKLIAPEMEKGLGQLKLAAEAQEKVEAYRVERSASVAAPPAAVLAEIVDLTGWTRWSPWEQVSPEVNRMYGGPPSGAGASYYWSVAGEPAPNRVTIISVTAGKVEIELERSGRSPMDLELGLVAVDAGTHVTWVMTGEDDPQGTIARDFERGLARLKSVLEGEHMAAR